MQSLYYESSSLLLTLIKEDGSYSFWNDITSIATSASAYSVPDSGSTNFGITVGQLSIYAYSGSTIIATFPSDETNIYYTTLPSSFPPTPTSSFLGSLNWNFNNDFTSSNNFGFNISSSDFYYNLSGSTGAGGLSLNNVTYSFFVSGSGSYDAYLYINNIYSGSIYTLSSSGYGLSASFVPLPFNYYEVTFSLVDTSP
jgi:hypothetical protein